MLESVLMAHEPGTRLRKGPFEVPYPWSESINHTRRYRNGWFDGARIGETVVAPGHYGTNNSPGRDAYIAGFDAGLRHYARTAIPVPKPVEPEPLAPGELPPPEPGDWHLPYLPLKA